MFDWFFDFLYLLTRSIFRIIDAMVEGTNMLCGITPVTIEGKKTDLMTWMLSLSQVSTGFKVTALVGLFLVTFFAIWGIVKNIVSEKPEGTPGQICIKAFKAILTFLFIPAAMYALTKSLNTLAEVLYDGTRGGAELSLGGFLAKSFGQDCMNDGLNVWTATDFDYTSFDCMWKYFNMRHYDYFFSWFAGIFIIITMSKVLFVFVERLFSIILLYIISPIPVSATILDDGAKFKQWREQLLAKYCTGYGAILGLNIYTIVISALCTYDVEYFSNSFVNFVFKLIIIIGGSFGLDKLVTMIGNLVSNGAGDSAMHDATAMRGGVVAIGSGAAKLGKKGYNWAKKKLTGGKQLPQGYNGGSQGEGDGEGNGQGNGNGNGSYANNANRLLGMSKEAFNDNGNIVKLMFKQDPESKQQKKDASESLDPLHKNKGKGIKGVVVGQGKNGGFTLSLSNNKGNKK